MTKSTQPEQSGPLKGHTRRGKIFQPPLVAMGGLETTNWFRNDLPDLIWPVSLVCDEQLPGAVRFSRLQQTLVAELGLSFIADHAIVFDGGLSALEEIPDDARNSILELTGRGEFADLMRIGHEVLSLYENPPGWWLFQGLGPAETDSEVLYGIRRKLAASIGRVIGDGHSNALVKAMRIGWLLGTEKLRIPPDFGSILIGYPVDEGTRSKADSFIRATYQGTVSLLSERGEARAAWVRQFWDTNYEDSSCHLESQIGNLFSDEISTPPEENGEPKEPKEVEWSEASSTLSQDVSRMFGELTDRATEAVEVVDIYTPARCEVVLGQLSRCSRIALRFFSTPWMWTGEFSSGVLRTIVEAQVQLAWMSQQPIEDGVFERYQEFGHGKRKLYRSLMAERIQNAEEAGFEVPKGLRDAEERFAEVGGGRFEEQLREVSVDSTFIKGKSLRDMASEAGLDGRYRHIFQVASGVVHGEWWAIEDYGMERCWNPLHRLHWVPCPVEMAAPDAQAAANVRDQMFTLAAIAESALGLEETQLANFDPRKS